MLALVIASFSLQVAGGIGALVSGAEQREVSGAEAEANIAALEDFLSRYPQYAAQMQGQYQEAGIKELRGLRGALGGANVALGATGQAVPGSSLGLVAEERRGDVVRFAGEDLSLAGTEGLYGQGLEVLKGNLEAQRKQAEGQLDVWEKVGEAAEHGPLGDIVEGIRDFFDWGWW